MCRWIQGSTARDPCLLLFALTVNARHRIYVICAKNQSDTSTQDLLVQLSLTTVCAMTPPCSSACRDFDSKDSIRTSEHVMNEENITVLSRDKANFRVQQVWTLLV